MDSKVCTKCNELKPLSDFYNDKRVKKDGKAAQCKACSNAQNKAYRETHKEQRNEYERNRRATDESWNKQISERNIRYFEKMKEENGERLQNYKERTKRWNKSRDPRYNMWMGARDRAYNKKLEFNIDLEDIIIPDICPILNIPLVKNSKQADKDSMTLDRIIPELGYVKGNIRVISRLANAMKQDASFEQLKLFAENIIKYINNEDIVRTTENIESVELKDKEPLG